MSAPKWSKRDEQDFFRLLKKYAPAGVREQIEWTPERCVNLDDMFFAVLIDELVAEHCEGPVQNRKIPRGAYKEAFTNIFLATAAKEQQTDVEQEKFVQRAKKKYHRGRRMNREMAEHGGILRFRVGE